MAACWSVASLMSTMFASVSNYTPYGTIWTQTISYKHSYCTIVLVWLSSFTLIHLLFASVWQVPKQTDCIVCIHFISLSVSDLSLDSKLELLKTREYAEYIYRSLAEYKDGRFKGQWRTAKPHGRYSYYNVL